MVNVEKLIPRLEEVRAQERQNRALAFAGLTHTVCGREIMPLTPGHRLNLQLMRNAFAVIGEEPTLEDVFVFLWVLSPHNTGGAEAARQQYFLREDVKAFNLRESMHQILHYILDQLQDTSTGSGEGKDFSPWVHWAAMDSFFYKNECGIDREVYMRTPYLVLQQQYRAWQCNNPNMERMKDGTVFVRDPIFFNSSDKLVSAWHREHREQIKAWHLSQRTRRN